MKHTVIGTAGHIDHGKTLLLKAITGVDADRLPEEKERGMTIDLGFVFLGEDVTIIDVPGHEKFIKNMLAGVSTIDFVILVIAADDGIMPQTREHFEILKLLDIRHGIIALTKTDIVDEEWLELVKDDIRQFVKGSFLEDALIMPVSSITGDGIGEFKDHLKKMMDETPAKSDKGIFRLWIDRVFVLKGIGTVIAGTVLSGSMKPGDKLALLPKGKDVRVRKLQVHNRDVEKSIIGERVAVNLQGVEASEIERGNLIATPGHFEPTYMINAKLYLLKDYGRPLKSRSRIRFHIGTRELLARAVTLDKKPLLPGESTLVQFRLEEQVSLEIGDRFIIRSYSPAFTIGGGSIIETHPKKLKYLPDDELDKLDNLENAGIRQIVLHCMANHPLEAFSAVSLSKELSLRKEDLSGIISDLLEENIAAVTAERPEISIVLTEHLTAAVEKTVDFLETYHRQFPYLTGIKKSELKSRLFADTGNTVFDVILSRILEDKKVILKEETVFLASHRIKFTGQQEEIKNRIEEIYLDAGYVTPSVDEIKKEFPKQKKSEILNLITGMVELGILVEIKTELEKPAIFHSKNVKAAEKLLVEMLEEKGEIRLFEFREKINSTRKFTTPLLIYFDRRGLTERDGEVRRLRTV